MSETDDKIKEGVEHLQNAALELIAAARVFLDLAEQAVKDPSEVVAVASELAARMPRTSHHQPASDAADAGVQRIRIV